MSDAPIDTHTLNATSYDAIAEHYTSWSLSHQSQIPKSSNPRLLYLDKLFSYLPCPVTASVLDLGCGAGVPCTQLLARTCHKGKVVGVDSSSTMIELARRYVLGDAEPGIACEAGSADHGIEKGVEQEGERGAGALADVELQVADMTALSFPPASFDAVVAFYSIIHLPRDELKGMLEQIAEWLVSEDTESGRQGYLLLNLGTTDDPGAYSRKWLGSTDGHMFWSSFDYATNLTMLEEAGFEIVESAVVEDREDGKIVPFLWVFARKKLSRGGE